MVTDTHQLSQGGIGGVGVCSQPYEGNQTGCAMAPTAAGTEAAAAAAASAARGPCPDLLACLLVVLPAPQLAS